MIQSDDGMVILKGTFDEAMTDLTAIVMGLSTKFPKEAIMSAVAIGLTEAESDHLDDIMEVVVDKTMDKESDDGKSPDKEDLGSEVLKKMFGDLFHE